MTNTWDVITYVFLYYSEDEYVEGSYMYGGIPCLASSIAWPVPLLHCFLCACWYKCCVMSLCSLTLAQILGGCRIFSSRGFEKKARYAPTFVIQCSSLTSVGLKFGLTYKYWVLSPPEIRLYSQHLEFQEMLSAFPRMVVGTMPNLGEIIILPIPGSNKKQDDSFSPFITRVCLCMPCAVSHISTSMYDVLLVIYPPICVILSVFRLTLFACTCQLWTDSISLISA